MATVLPDDPQQLLRMSQTAEGKRDPHILYDRIRALTPILRDVDSGMWFVFRWSDCNDVMRSKRFGAPGLLQLEPRFDRSASLMFLADTLSNLDAPHHTRLRGQVQKSFSAPVLKRSQDYVDEVIAAAIAEMADRETFDVVVDYAAKIPNTVICEMLGVPRADHVRFGGWLSDQFRLLGPTPPADALLDEVDGSTQQLVAYMEDLIAERTRAPRTDIISELIAAQQGADEPMSVREMTVTTSILLAGGSDTTKTAIAIGTRLLLEHPEQRDRLIADPALAASAFEEILRVGGAVLMANSRKALEDSEIAGETIRAGEFVVPVIAAANHDPAKFADPMRFDIARSPNPHIAFGGGIHVCIGNMMARMVGSRAIMALARAYPKMRMLDDGRDINPALMALRGLLTLPVATG